MKRFVNYLVWAVLLAFVLGCKPKTPDPLVDGTPRIVSIKFPGIPAEDVSIDQQNFVITVKVPPLLPAAFEPEVKVTENAKLRYVDWRWLFTSTDNRPRISLDYSDGDQGIEAWYTLKLLPTGPFTIVNSSSLVEFVLNNGQTSHAYFPVKNLYGNELPSKIRIKQEKRGNYHL